MKQNLITLITPVILLGVAVLPSCNKENCFAPAAQNNKNNNCSDNAGSDINTGNLVQAKEISGKEIAAIQEAKKIASQNALVQQAISDVEGAGYDVTSIEGIILEEVSNLTIMIYPPPPGYQSLKTGYRVQLTYHIASKPGIYPFWYPGEPVVIVNTLENTVESVNGVATI